MEKIGPYTNVMILDYYTVLVEWLYGCQWGMRHATQFASTPFCD